MKASNVILTSLLSAMSLITINAQVANAEWKNSTSNRWWYEKGNSYAIGWEHINNNWYYFDNTGYMKTGWIYSSNNWYYMNLDGSMKIGWIYDNGHWYFANYHGEMQTGFIQVDSKTYYLSPSGAMQTGNITIDGKLYSFAVTGEAQGDKFPMATKSFTLDGVITQPTEKNNTNTIGKKTVEIDLESNPTTGYDWQYSADKDGIIKEVSKVYKSDDVPKDVCGSGGTDIWTFEGLKEGSTEVTFKYLRPWEKEVIKTRIFIFTVDKDLKVKVTEKS